jgi:glutaredoxin
MNIIYILVICVLVLVLAYSFRPNYSNYEKKDAPAPDAVPVIYGAGFCGYCTKQKEELDAANVNYIYYDCMLPENKDRCKDIKSYPTVVFPGQDPKPGKQPVELFAAYVKK